MKSGLFYTKQSTMNTVLLSPVAYQVSITSLFQVRFRDIIIMGTPWQKMDVNDRSHIFKIYSQDSIDGYSRRLCAAFYYIVKPPVMRYM